MHNKRLDILLAGITLASLGLTSGCKKPYEYRQEADQRAYELIHKTEKKLFNRESVFTIETAEDQLRRRLMEAQGLPYSCPASLGFENLDKPEFWPEKDYPAPVELLADQSLYHEPLKVSLTDALQMAAAHNFEYQSEKEKVYASALSFDLTEHGFDSIFSAGSEHSLSNINEPNTVNTLSNTGNIKASKKLANGTEISAGIFVSLAQILTPDKAVGRGTSSEVSITIPLLRGSGEHIVTEGLTQSQRNLIYAVSEFERYKKRFAINIISSYYNVLKQGNQIANAKANYESVKTSAARSRRLAEAGRMTNIERDQAIQDELGARNSWLSSVETYKTTLDSFKNMLGLPTDAKVELDNSELAKVIAYTEEALNIDLTPERDTKIEFNDIPGPFELDELEAINIALTNRLDIKNAQGKVYDRQRAVVVKADQLRAELTLLGKANFGGSASTNGSDNGLAFDNGRYQALFTLDLPIERTRERNEYRESYINLQKSVRDLQSLEDQVKLEIRRGLRNLKDQRNSLQIQAESVRLAEDRVRSTNMFLEAGRIQMRDLLDAEKSLLNARNNITASVISYRLAELELQRDMGKLEIDQTGLWLEYKPNHDNNTALSNQNQNDIL